MIESRIQCDLPDNVYKQFRTLATDADRSVSGHLRYVVKKYIADFVKEHEHLFEENK
jgi:hypothetical protein